MKIIFCGDIMPGGVLPYQTDFISSNIKEILYNADFRVGTLECAIGDNIPFDEHKMQMEWGKNIVYARESDFSRIIELGLNLVSLANNHSFDLGVEGLKNTIRLLKENNILFCGAGLNLEEASRPCFVESRGSKYAFIGCCFKELPPYTVQAATREEPGIFQTNGEEISRMIEETKKTANYVIILPHWGVEYSYIPPTACRLLAKQMIDAGADAIIGSHTHIINPREEYKDKPIYYSLGNFLFPDFCLQVPRPISYPQTREDVYNLPVVYNYPKSIKKPVRVVWGRSSRIGILPVLNFINTGKILHKCFFTVLGSDNVIRLLDGNKKCKEKIKMSFYGTLFGETIFRLRRKVLNSRFNVFKRFLKG